jgi:cytochrome c553
MPALPLGADDVRAVVEFIHSLTAASPGQGAPPHAELPPPDIVVGDAAAGRGYFAAKCSACHSADGDLRGIAGKVADAKVLQNLWVSGGVTGRGRPRSADEPASPVVTATVTTREGERIHGRLSFIDDFEIKLALEDGTIRGFSRNGGVPHVDIVDPLEAHKALLSALTDKDMRNVTAYLVTLK